MAWLASQRGRSARSTPLHLDVTVSGKGLQHCTGGSHILSSIVRPNLSIFSVATPGQGGGGWGGGGSLSDETQVPAMPGQPACAGAPCHPQVFHLVIPCGTFESLPPSQVPRAAQRCLTSSVRQPWGCLQAGMWGGRRSNGHHRSHRCRVSHGHPAAASGQPIPCAQSCSHTVCAATQAGNPHPWRRSSLYRFQAVQRHSPETQAEIVARPSAFDRTNMLGQLN